MKTALKTFNVTRYDEQLDVTIILEEHEKNGPYNVTTTSYRVVVDSSKDMEAKFYTFDLFQAKEANAKFKEEVSKYL